MKFTNGIIIFSYIYTCVDVVVHFAIDLVTMIYHKKCTCLQTIQFFSFVCIPYIDAFLINKSPWACALTQL